MKSNSIFYNISFYVVGLLFILSFNSCSEDPTDPVGSELSTEEKFALLTEDQIESIAYFGDIALGFEFGNSSEITRKWTSNALIDVRGNMPTYLLDEMDLIIAEINTLVTDGFEMRLKAEDETANFLVFFGSGEEYADVNPSAREFVNGNRGLFFVNWNSGQNLTRADMYVDTETIEEVFQRHLLREELTQALGLAKDSNQYSESIFQSNWTSVTSFSELDESLIRLLYHPDMISGLDSGESRKRLIDILYEEL